MPGALPDRMQSLFYVADLLFAPLFLFLLASFDRVLCTFRGNMQCAGQSCMDLVGESPIVEG